MHKQQRAVLGQRCWAAAGLESGLVFPTHFPYKSADGINPRRPNRGLEPRSSPEGILISANTKWDGRMQIGRAERVFRRCNLV